MMLSIQNLTKTYPNGVKALDEINLDIRPGMFGLLGPNGAGKSSLMRTIATLQSPDSGSVVFNGIDISKAPMSLRKTLGYLPQEFGVYPKETAENLLHYFALLKGLSARKERKSKVDEVLSLTNLSEVRKKHVSSFSGGMRQRFGIAQLLLNDPQLIIVDEPTAGLDPEERNRFLNVLRGIGTENIVLFSTHLVEDVKELCTDMAIMKQGKIHKRATPTEAVKELKSKIWTKSVPAADLDFYKANYHFLSSSFKEDHSLIIRVFAESRPDMSFQIAEKVNVEDVFFYALGNKEEEYV